MVVWSKLLAAVGVTGLVGLLGGNGSVLPSLVFFFLRNPRLGIKFTWTRQPSAARTVLLDKHDRE